MTPPVGPPDRLVDPEAGTLLLRLVSTRPATVGEAATDEERWAAVRESLDELESAPTGRAGLAEPHDLAVDAEPVDVVLHGETTPADLQDLALRRSPGTELDDRHWFTWWAHARTPVGWCRYPGPSFLIAPGARVDEARLRHVALHLVGGTPVERFDVMNDWLIHELGPPASASGDGKRRLDRRERTWTYLWGSVRLWHEYRDHDAEIAVAWHPPPAERRGRWWR